MKVRIDVFDDEKLYAEIRKFVIEYNPANLLVINDGKACDLANLPHCN